MDSSEGKDVISPVGSCFFVLADVDFSWSGGGGVRVVVGGRKRRWTRAKDSTCVLNADAQCFKGKL